MARLVFSCLFLGALPVHSLEFHGRCYFQRGMSCRSSARRAGCQRSTLLHASICDAEAWPSLQAELDELPVFLLANARGDPLQHNGPDGAPTLVFFADLFRAEAELANANRLYHELQLELLPIGLGDAFQRVQEGKATLVASHNELSNSGLDPDGTPNTVPLFGCTKLMQPRRNNPELKAMPLFLSSEDAKAALDAALNASGFVIPPGMEAQGVGLDILAITLQKACELMVSGQESRFEFFPPTKSAEWIQEYTQRKQEAGKTDDGGLATGTDANGKAAKTSLDAEKQAMFETIIDQRQEMLKRTGGVIPGQRPAENGG